MLLRVLMLTLLALSLACGDSEPGTQSQPRDTGSDTSEPDTDTSPDADTGEELDAGEGPDAGEEPDAGEDTDTSDEPDADADADVDAPNCTCDAATECCNGCDPINAGASCDDGLECTLGTTCQPDGTCGEATGSPCDALIDHPECQSVSCDEVTGCGTVQPVRETFTCETDTEDLRVIDGTCQAGECVGRVCTCDEESSCCNGCEPIAEGEACDDGNPDTGGDSCQAGACVGEPCNCDEETACCDGCFLKAAGTICSENSTEWRRECVDSYRYVIVSSYAGCTGEHSECFNAREYWVTERSEVYECGAVQTCRNNSCQY
ncbi:hypothetical protein DV096_20470 [Bradymonadaceae bacterium TMQ3]|nr:hypothetical protein DV096_20470 [Bradymonadaceae bacterium TMQ3]TXC67611.1 hypothetical protein FRC91_20285 [Bradymonadales bacterium TMQ1]